jgi:methylglutaconyl-CoA hydratase
VTDEPAVHYQVSGPVATLTMDQLHNRNALTTALLSGLADGLAAAVEDPAVRVVVLTHTGPAFCAGADISAGGRGSAAVAPRAGLADVLAAIQDSPKPVVGRIAGHCTGGGVGLAAVCDISIAAEDTRLAFTEVRLGLAPAMISVVCLPKLRRGDALELFLSGERIPARRAADLGLITRAVPAGELDAAVDECVTRLLAGGPGGLAASKALVYDVPRLERNEAYERTMQISAALFASEEGAEGMAAFREKRPPRWAPPPT